MVGGMLVDDFIMRQIQKIADMLAAIARAPVGSLPEGAEQDLRDVYRDLLGMDPDDVEMLDDETLLRALRTDAEKEALVDLLRVHAEVCARTDDLGGARRRLARAIGLMPEGDARLEAALMRLGELG